MGTWLDFCSSFWSFWSVLYLSEVLYIPFFPLLWFCCWLCWCGLVWKWKYVCLCDCVIDTCSVFTCPEWCKCFRARSCKKKPKCCKPGGVLWCKNAKCQLMTMNFHQTHNFTYIRPTPPSRFGMNVSEYSQSFHIYSLAPAVKRSVQWSFDRSALWSRLASEQQCLTTCDFIPSHVNEGLLLGLGNAPLPI